MKEYIAAVYCQTEDQAAELFDYWGRMFNATWVGSTAVVNSGSTMFDDKNHMGDGVYYHLTERHRIQYSPNNFAERNRFFDDAFLGDFEEYMRSIGEREEIHLHENESAALSGLFGVVVPI